MARLAFVDPLAKADEIPERVDRPGLQRAPWRLLKTRPHVAIILRADLAMEFLDAAHHHPQPRARRAITVVLAQVQDEVAARYLAVERRVVVEAVIPVDLEAEEALIELVRLGDVEDAQDRHDADELNGHRVAPVHARWRALDGVGRLFHGKWSV